MPEISVLIPCYNCLETIDDALQTIADQDHLDFEVVLVDDGSTDGSLEILQGWQSKDPRFRVLPVEHGGIIHALNEGIKACRGKYIARMDADDRSYPGRLSAQAAILDQHPEVSVVSCLVEAFPQEDVRMGFELYLEWLNSLQSHDEIILNRFIESPVVHPSTMVRKAELVELGGYIENGWAEDYDLWLRYAQAGKRFYKIPELLFGWREHETRLTRTDSRYSVENFIRAKAHYIAQGPLADVCAVIIWGAGMMGRRLCKHLERQDLPLIAFLDVDPNKIGKTKRHLPIHAVEELPELLKANPGAVVVAAVSSRGVREIIRGHMADLGLVEGVDWWSAA